MYYVYQLNEQIQLKKRQSYVYIKITQHKKVLLNILILTSSLKCKLRVTETVVPLQTLGQTAKRYKNNGYGTRYMTFAAIADVR